MCACAVTSASYGAASKLGVSGPGTITGMELSSYGVMFSTF